MKMVENKKPEAPKSSDELDSDLDGIDLTLGPDEVEISPGELEDFRREVEVTFFALVQEDKIPPPKALSPKGPEVQPAQKGQEEPIKAGGPGMTIEDLLLQLDKRRSEDKEEFNKARADDKAEAEKNYKLLRSEAAKNVRELKRTIVGNHSEMTLKIAAASSASDARPSKRRSGIWRLKGPRPRGRGPGSTARKRLSWLLLLAEDC